MNAPDTIELTDAPIAAYSPTAAALADLQHRFKGVVFDVTTTKGDKEARGFRKELVGLRTGLEAKRKELKAPALAYAKRIDDEAKALNGQILELEEPLDAQIKAEEQKKEAERAARAEAERVRIAAIHDRIQKDIVNAVHGAAGQTFSRISQIISDIGAMVIGSEFEEFQGQAQLAKDETLDKLREMQSDALAREKEAERVKAEQEAEQARLVAERAELERLRAAEAERVAAANAEREAAEKEQAARLAAERDAHEAEMRAAREAQERELAAQRAEQARVDAEAAAKRKAEEDEIAARLKALADEREAVAAEQRRQEQIEAQKRAAAEAALNRIERAGPVLLAALKSVKDCGAWNDIEDHVQEAVERAIEEATGQPA